MPGLQQIIYDGWLLRFGRGYTRRLNSVNLLYPDCLDVSEKIATCEACYTARNLTPIFRLTSFATPPGLDQALEQERNPE